MIETRVMAVLEILTSELETYNVTDEPDDGDLDRELRLRRRHFNSLGQMYSESRTVTALSVKRPALSKE